MEILICILAASGCANLFHFSLGSPNKNTNNYDPEKIFSPLGEWLLDKYTIDKIFAFGVFLCPICLTPWLSVIFAIVYLFYPPAVTLLAVIGGAHIVQKILTKL